jgi:hypothetical protein
MNKVRSDQSGSNQDSFSKAKEQWQPAVERMAQLVRENADLAPSIWLRDLAWLARRIHLAKAQYENEFFYYLGYSGELDRINSAKPEQKESMVIEARRSLGKYPEYASKERLWHLAQEDEIPRWTAEFAVYKTLVGQGKIQEPQGGVPSLFDAEIVDFIKEHPLPTDDAKSLAGTLAMIKQHIPAQPS